MAKSELHDIQILQTMIDVQAEIQDIFDEAGVTIEDVVLDDKAFKLIYFNTIRLLNLTKHLSSKTKKNVLIFMDDFKNKMILEGLSYCYPRISREEIVRYAISISDEDSKYSLREYRMICIEKIENK